MDFAAAILADDERYQELVRIAVADPFVYAKVQTVLKTLFESADTATCKRVLEVAAHFGDREFASIAAHRLVKDAAAVGGVPDWAVDGIDYLATQMVPSDPIRDQVFQFAMAQPETRLQGWRMSSSGDAAAVIPHVRALLTEHADEAKAIGIKFALVWQPSCLDLADALRGMKTCAALTVLQETLEVYLRRVRRAGLWIQFKRRIQAE